MFILLHGSDEFIAREELTRLKAESDFAAGADTYSGTDDRIEDILAACDTAPFLSERRLVVTLGLPRHKGKAGSSGGGDLKAFTEALARYVPHMPGTTALVIVVDELLEADSQLVRLAKSHGEVKACVAPRGNQLEEWLIRRARAAGRELTPDAARLLASGSGESLRALAGEVEKLCTYVGPGGRIGLEEVHALAPASRSARVFDLTDALARRDRGRGLVILHELLDSGESPFGIVALVAVQTRSLIQVKALSERRSMRAAEIARTAGLAPYVVEKSLPLARQFTLAQLEATHRRLLDIDTSLKQSKMTPEMALDLLVCEFGTVVAP
jgi:DNA polymerase-3 subunit delta